MSTHHRQQAIDALLDHIRAEALSCGACTGRPMLSDRVMRAMAAVPRDAFVDPDLQDEAWLDAPLPIGHQQTISQPFIVALMTDLIDPKPDDVVLEIGTGSGYQAAVLAGLVKQVQSVEVIGALARMAAQRLQGMGLHNVHVHHSDGHSGWPAGGPYDAIVVTAASPVIPPALVEQLKPGGRMVIPVGPQHGRQELVLVSKDAQGQVTESGLLPVAFVPLTGGAPALRA
ncbi:MAG: protein-L-isoaspartate(D-aspartate) O-methyltransferase [Aquabacterium sp.]|uniref:protein-L-isoaspartate(D-aspartate) O-methyltransferase n=1 Tax=Aquabacterium sp. TaxID=1872578 RepID=UPI0025BC8487|nr:protein-L-isoaspartate(D-aspartate) O-methyltransferase [Aquabacterium sp.]MBI3380627.1 protein-L-isoaspartate(D-aspartate) O-methyltransferase [Aquabacterium sp.]